MNPEQSRLATSWPKPRRALYKPIWLKKASEHIQWYLDHLNIDHNFDHISHFDHQMYQRYQRCKNELALAATPKEYCFRKTYAA